ncbi:uncharacterized protein N7458_006661 [Penicillium daleae]|uniref:Uncharacterized protein n=1 Tax=Penicillium daleae TaxID=63821 RepID=A0AAD6C4Q2_9EURO|nr:uncharacterized protein N7458_006661 [Penicillium daleae]KAJ5450212.1 hypothetical protein N7458_006661 [Penicillium daleae]
MNIPKVQNSTSPGRAKAGTSSAIFTRKPRLNGYPRRKNKQSIQSTGSVVVVTIYIPSNVIGCRYPGVTYRCGPWELRLQELQLASEPPLTL